MQIDDIIKKINRGTTEIINVDGLKKKLSEGRTLRVKSGFDPTAPDIHLGHVVLLRKLRQFQDLGHKIDFLIGDFTALVGDPTGRNELRPNLDLSYIRDNAKTYIKQAFKILDSDEKKIEVVYNYDWLDKLTSQQMLELTASSTVAQMLARSDFKQRFENNTEISIMEFIYPLLQGYDSVHLKTDIEIGGTDQKFNLLMGRQLQEIKGQDPQVVIMTPLLEGLDGVKKMSKSLGNYIGIDDPPGEILGKIMSISDDLMFRYYEILTEIDIESIKELHPKEAKLQLGQEIVSQFYSEDKALKVRQEFEKVFSQGQTPEDILEYKFNRDEKKLLFDVLVETKLADSKNEARRLLKQGSISFQGEKIQDENWSFQVGILKVGKRRFLKLV